MSHTRFAIYHLPPAGALAGFGARWLGWDVANGAAVTQPPVAGIEAVTAAPRKYGFHGTLKPPFRLAEGRSPDALADAVASMARGCAPASCDRLRLARLGRFLALTPQGDAAGIARVAATCVEALDAFRAPAGDAELARRRKAGLSARQETLLARWGYPYVMEEFRFHLTLTGPLPDAEIGRWSEAVATHLPPLPAPFVLDSVALVGERADGRFETIQRYALVG
jgi:putative phosphonate metabolism protein